MQISAQSLFLWKPTRKKGGPRTDTLNWDFRAGPPYWPASNEEPTPAGTSHVEVVQLLKCSRGWTGMRGRVEGNALVGIIAQALESDCKWLLLSATNTLEKDNERLKVINHRGKVKYETKSTLVLPKRRSSPKKKGMKGSGSSPGLTYKNSSTSKKAEFSTLTNPLMPKLAPCLGRSGTLALGMGSTCSRILKP